MARPAPRLRPAPLPAARRSRRPVPGPLPALGFWVALLALPRPARLAAPPRGRAPRRAPRFPSPFLARAGLWRAALLLPARPGARSFF